MTPPTADRATAARRAQCLAALLAAFASCLVGSGLAAWPAAAAATPTTVVPTVTIVSTVHGEDPIAVGVADAHSRAVEIRRIAQFDPTISSVLADRPDLLVISSFRPSSRDWSVHLREAGGTLDLARIVIDDRSHHVSDRFLLSRADWPPRQLSRHVRAVVLANRETRRRIAELGGLRRLKVQVVAPAGDHSWQVDFSRHDDVLLQVELADTTGQVTGVWHGHQVAWSMARGIQGAFGGRLDRWYTWLVSYLLFAIILVDWRRWRRLATLDVVAILAFGVSWWYFDRGRIEWSVPLAVPPLAWLTGRMAWIFARGVPASPRAGSSASWSRHAQAAVPVDGLARRRQQRRARQRAVLGRLVAVPTWTIVLLAVLACGARWGLDGWGGNVIDVGYAGVAGAHSIAANRTPYGNMPADNENGDTYGPLDYVAYLPAIAVWHDTNWGDGLPAAKAVSIGSDVLCVLALLLVGWRWLSRRAAALLVLAWASCPWTLLALCSNSNDLLVAALLLLAFAALRHPVPRGIAIGAAASVKFVPLVVLGAMAHCGVGARWRQAWRTGVGVAAVGVSSIVFVAGWKGGWHAFVHATFGFQYGRISPFSPWGLYGWRHAQQAAQLVLLALVVVSALRPRVRDFRQVAAGAAAAIGGLELTLQHWFYLYLPWMLGLVIVVLIAERYDDAAPLAMGDGPQRV